MQHKWQHYRLAPTSTGVRGAKLPGMQKSKHDAINTSTGSWCTFRHIQVLSNLWIEVIRNYDNKKTQWLTVVNHCVFCNGPSGGRTRTILWGSTDFKSVASANSAIGPSHDAGHLTGGYFIRLWRVCLWHSQMDITRHVWLWRGCWYCFIGMVVLDLVWNVAIYHGKRLMILGKRQP